MQIFLHMDWRKPNLKNEVTKLSRKAISQGTRVSGHEEAARGRKLILAYTTGQKASETGKHTANTRDFCKKGLD